MKWHLLSIRRCGHRRVIMSNYTGEIIFLHELHKLPRLIRDAIEIRHHPCGPTRVDVE